MPKIIGSSLQEHRTQMHQRIFDALTELLADVGYDAVGLADVAARAGIGRTAMYNYYPDKETLLLAYAESETDRFLDDLNSRLETVTNPVDRLTVYIAALIHEVASQSFSASAMSNVMSESGRRAMREHVAPLWGTLSTILNEAIEERYLPAGDLMLRMQLVFGAVNGRATAGLTGDDLEHAIAVTTEFSLRGLGAKLSADGQPRRLRSS